ncbi:MAG: sigma-54 dependent transcriptional regulator [Pseudomonadota bacterium]
MNKAHILVVDDDAAMRQAIADILRDDGFDVSDAANAHDALTMMHSASHYDLVVSDVQMRPMDGVSLLKSVREARMDVPVVLMTAFGTVEQAVETLQAGASHYLAKPIESDKLLSTVRALTERREAIGGDFLAGDEKTLDLLQLARRVAESEVSVMISGPSGAGKEVMARYIHNNSQRAERPFVAINCAAIPENMLEAVLFGYEKGAYTGAHRSMPGKFEQAQGGTLLLDEISEMDLGLQAKLLRVLQEREVERLGSRESISLDVRILATTNRNLRAEVAANRFREDLFYRLNVFPLRLPPLAERGDDIEPLARLFVAKHTPVKDMPKPISAAAVARLRQHKWPGNVRELDNVMQRALVLTEGREIGVADIHFEEHERVQPDHVEESASAGGDSPLGNTLKSRESEMILDALKACNGSRKAAAEALGISPRTLRYKLSRLREQGIRVPEAYGYSNV